MAHLGDIQHLLNNDADYRVRFLHDPVAALAEQGLALLPAMEAQLRQLVAQAQAASPQTPGAAFGPGGGPASTCIVLGAGAPEGRNKGLALIIFFE